MAELVATSTFPPPSIKSVMALTLRDPPNSEIKKDVTKQQQFSSNKPSIYYCLSRVNLYCKCQNYFNHILLLANLPAPNLQTMTYQANLVYIEILFLPYTVYLFRLTNHSM